MNAFFIRACVVLFGSVGAVQSNALLGRYRADFPEQCETWVQNSRTAREDDVWLTVGMPSTRVS